MDSTSTICRPSMSSPKDRRYDYTHILFIFNFTSITIIPSLLFPLPASSRPQYSWSPIFEAAPNFLLWRAWVVDDRAHSTWGIKALSASMSFCRWGSRCMSWLMGHRSCSCGRLVVFQDSGMCYFLVFSGSNRSRTLWIKHQLLYQYKGLSVFPRVGRYECWNRQ